MYRLKLILKLICGHTSRWWKVGEKYGLCHFPPCDVFEKNLPWNHNFHLNNLILWFPRLRLSMLFNYINAIYNQIYSALSSVSKNRLHTDIGYIPIFFDFRFKNFFISGLTKSPITSGKVKICRQIFDMFLRMFQTICRPIFSDFEPATLFSTLMTHIHGTGSHMSHSDVIYFTGLKSSLEQEIS